MFGETSEKMEEFMSNTKRVMIKWKMHVLMLYNNPSFLADILQSAQVSIIHTP